MEEIKITSYLWTLSPGWGLAFNERNFVRREPALGANFRFIIMEARDKNSWNGRCTSGVPQPKAEVYSLIIFDLHHGPRRLLDRRYADDMFIFLCHSHDFLDFLDEFSFVRTAFIATNETKPPDTFTKHISLPHL